MSISAVIRWTREEPNGTLTLGLGQHKGEGPGQSELRVSSWTVKPKPGREIWGGARFCFVEPITPGELRIEYHRETVMTLVEARTHVSR